MSMNALLAEHYGTAPSTAPAVDLQKQAQVDWFVKTAAENNIDLNALSQEQIEHLWNHTFSKEAEEEEKKEEAKDEKKPEEKEKDSEGDDAEKLEAAKKEHEEKKEEEKKANAELAEADFIGRTMAHAYVNEINKIASALKEGREPEPPVKMAAMPEALRKGLEAAKGGGKAVMRTANSIANKASDIGSKGPSKTRDAVAAHGGKALVGAGGAAAAVGAGKLMKKKESSALDEIAISHAVKMAADAGFDSDEATARVNAVATLGLNESNKIASIEDSIEAINVRALEILEQAGYPVQWNEPQ